MHFGSIYDMQLHPKSIHFPLLRKFICKGTFANVVICAIVAPNLTHFTYYPYPWSRHPGAWQDNDAEGICSLFPSVHHIELPTDVMTFIFHQKNDLDALYWSNLENLTVHELGGDSLPFLDGLVTWLEQRQNIEQSKLLIKFILPGFLTYEDSHIAVKLEVLCKYCILEWEDLHSTIVLSGIAHESLWIEMPRIHPDLIDKIGKAFIAGHIHTTAPQCTCGAV
ncbi:hypothetical protein J3A83DRAFT_593791 [Scleroderma citrinum]